MEIQKEQDEATHIYNIVKNDIKSLDFIMKYYTPQNNIYEQTFLLENSYSKKSTFITYKLNQYLCKKAIDFINFNEQDFLSFIDKYQLNDNDLSIYQVDFSYGIPEGEKNTVEEYIKNNQLKNFNKHKKEANLEDADINDIVKENNINFSDILLYSVFSDSNKQRLVKILAYLKKFNIKLEENNLFAQYAASFILPYSDLFNEYKKHLNVNFSKIKLFENFNTNIFSRNFSFHSSFVKYFYGAQKQEFLATCKLIIENSTYQNVDEKFNHISQMLKKSEQSNFKDMGKIFNELRDFMPLENDDYEILEQKYLKFAIEQKFYIKDVIEISKPIYKKQKTHLFTVDGDYFYTLAVNAPKFFNSSFSKLNDDVKISIINSNLKGKNIFTQLFTLSDYDLERLDDDLIKFICNNYNYEQFINDEKILLSLLSIPKNQTYLNNIFSGKIPTFNLNEQFLQYYSKKENINFSKECNLFLNFFNENNFIDDYNFNKGYKASESHQKTYEKILSPFMYLSKLSFNQNILEKFISTNSFNKDFYQFYFYLSKKNNCDQNFYNNLFQKLIIQIDKNDKDVNLKDYNIIYNSISFFLANNMKISISNLNRLKDIFTFQSEQLENYSRHPNDDIKKALSSVNIVEKLILDEQINSIDVKKERKYKI